MTGLVQNTALVCNPSKCVEQPAPVARASVEDAYLMNYACSKELQCVCGVVFEYSLRKHGRKRASVEDYLNRGDLVAFNSVPLGNKRRTGRSIRHHVVENTDICWASITFSHAGTFNCRPSDIIAIRENLFHVDTLDDVVELLEGLQIGLRSVESLEGTAER